LWTLRNSAYKNTTHNNINHKHKTHTANTQNTTTQNTNNNMKIGILSVQGDVYENISAFQRAFKDLGIEGAAVGVKTKEDFTGLDGLVIPGGESTTISKLIRINEIEDEIINLHKKNKKIWGICAGLILISKEGDSQTQKTNQSLLKLIDIKVDRNAFGRQKESFSADLDIKGIGSFKGVFIRAPAIREVGPGVEILSTYKDRIVAAKQDNVLVTAFHPELTDDSIVHKYFIEQL